MTQSGCKNSVFLGFIRKDAANAKEKRLNFIMKFSRLYLTKTSFCEIIYCIANCNSIFNFTSSPTKTPPVSKAEFQFNPQSLRLILP